MTTPDTPAERGRDELRERLADAAKFLRRCRGTEPVEFFEEHATACEEAAALLARQEAPTTSEIDSLDADMEALYDQLYAEGREGDALIVERAAYAIEALEVDRVLRAAPQETPICLQCIERAEQEVAAGHYYRADELMAALRERREPVCACGETHPDRTPLAAARPAPETREPEVLVAALRAIVDMEPEPFDFPADWDQQVAACEECKRWKDHPIQQGICDTHRQPLWDRDAHVKSEQRRLHYRMRSVAREALDAYVLAAAPAEATGRDAMDFCPTCKHPRWTTACQCAPASGEPSGADAAVSEALDAIKKAHAAVDDLCNGRRWTMSVPARPDADPDLVIGDALTKAERVIRSLTDVPTAPGAPEEGAGDAE